MDNKEWSYKHGMHRRTLEHVWNGLDTPTVMLSRYLWIRLINSRQSLTSELLPLLLAMSEGTKLWLVRFAKVQLIYAQFDKAY